MAVLQHLPQKSDLNARKGRVPEPVQAQFSKSALSCLALPRLAGVAMHYSGGHSAKPEPFEL
jgi:hypothetical protein